jgi:hypothetical protein
MVTADLHPSSAGGLESLPLEQELPEPDLLLTLIQDCVGVHAGQQAAHVAALLTAPSRLDADDAVSPLLANKVWVPGLLVGSPPEGSAAVADDTTVVPQVLLPRLGLFLANEADLEVEFVPWIFQTHFRRAAVHRNTDRDRGPRQKIGRHVSVYVFVFQSLKVFKRLEELLTSQ